MRVPGVQTTAAFFDVLEVTPIVGRVYTEADEGHGALAVIGEGLWQRQFGSRADIIGTRDPRQWHADHHRRRRTSHSVRHPLHGRPLDACARECADLPGAV